MTTNDILDLGMCVGVEYYPWPHDFIEEGETQGVSKAIPKTAIPEVVPGRTRLVLAHPRGIVTTTAENMNLWDLAVEIVHEYVVGTEHEPTPENKAEIVQRWLPDAKQASEGAWKLAFILDRLLDIDDKHRYRNRLGMCYFLREAERKKDLDRLAEKYGIRYMVQPCGLVKSCAECPESIPANCAEKAELGWIAYAYLTGAQYCAREGETELPVKLIGKDVEIVKVTYEGDTNE